jgi:hypothetical protein
MYPNGSSFVVHQKLNMPSCIDTAEEELLIWCKIANQCKFVQQGILSGDFNLLVKQNELLLTDEYAETINVVKVLFGGMTN